MRSCFTVFRFVICERFFDAHHLVGICSVRNVAAKLSEGTSNVVIGADALLSASCQGRMRGTFYVES